MRYGLACTSEPATEPVSLSQFKLAQRITWDAEDAYIADCLAYARQHIEKVTRRRFITQTWAMYLDSFPCWELILPIAPLVSVSSITYVADDGDTDTLSSSLYRVDSKREPGRITPVWGEVWPIHRIISNSVTVTGIFGYGAASAVPMQVKRAIITLAAHLYENREPVIVGTSVANIPWHLDAMIQLLSIGNYP